LSRYKNRRSVTQSRIQDLLGEHAPEELASTESAIATPEGTRVADVVWVSRGRWEEMQETGDPPTLAPKICIEMMSGLSDWAEMEERG